MPPRTDHRSLVTPAAVLTALALGAFAVSVDLHNDEPQAAALILVIGGGVLGLLAPHGAWRWAILLGLAIPVGDFLGPRLGLSSVAPQPFNAGAFVALIPAAIGTAIGAGLRTLIALPTGQPQRRP